MTPPMLRQLRHDVWATASLIARCRSLTDAQLELTVPGTYGTIRRTLEHIVGADESYLGRLGLAVADPFGPSANASLATIAAHFAHVTANMERIFAGDTFDPERAMPTRRAHGLDVPDLDVWTYAGTVGGFTDD
jgi:uncharacterized damage-inducible protein DinB